ncbi:MAG: ImmA/IrrE family metallo-endopeptidase [Oscillospiraceae bacterium]|nr:ImmA/IrrE family metallo-endopeptidase [Oscillospiraceae bacterium]
MHYTRKELDAIGEAALADFRSLLCRTAGGSIAPLPFPMPIDTFAALYLSLDVRYAPLSRDGNTWGVTAYADTLYHPFGAPKETGIELRANDVLLDDSFQDPLREKQLNPRRRFTLAHECAHQLLYHLEPDEQQSACRQMYAESRVYSFRELKTKEDWNEWQANVLGAALLMPALEVGEVMHELSPRHRLPCISGLFTWQALDILDRFCSYFGVSRSAAEIRLRELGFVNDFSSGTSRDLSAVTRPGTFYSPGETR